MFTPSTRKRTSALNAGRFRFGVVVSNFNAGISDALLNGALKCLAAHHAPKKNITVVRVPGAFEIPLTARRLAATETFSAIICLGAVIRGETAHFELVANECARGIMRVSMELNIPVLFGVLATNTRRQAEARAKNNESNKGWETAHAAIQMAALFASFDAAHKAPSDAT